MARNKLKKIQTVESFENVFSHESGAKESDLRNYFGNNNPISLEIGCGEADYTNEMAKLFPNRNFVGVDFKGARIYLGAKNALKEKLNNAAFLWIKAEFLAEFLKTEKIEEIFITFPEPHVKRRTENRRLVSPRFLDIYRKMMKPGGHVHLKTDDDFLYSYSKKVMKKEKLDVVFSTDDLYANKNLDAVKSIKTRFERYYLEHGRTIKYLEIILE